MGHIYFICICHASSIARDQVILRDVEDAWWGEMAIRHVCFGGTRAQTDEPRLFIPNSCSVR
jgi:hypothetical protein